MDAAGTSLLLRHENGVSYRYEPSTKALSPATPAQWAAGGSIANCEAQLPAVSFSPTGPDGGTRLAAPALVTTRVSPLKAHFAAVSALTPGTSVMPFLGQGHRGPYSLQVFSSDDVACGPVIALPFEPKTSAVSLCWSADEAFIAATDLINTVLTVSSLAPACRRHVD